MSEAVLDGQVELRGAKQAVEDVLQPDAVQVVELVCGNHFHVGQQVGGILLRACNTGLHLAASNANLVDQLAMLGHEWMAGVFDTEGLKEVRLPVQLWASAYGGDGVTPESVAAVRRDLPAPPDWHIAANAAHFAFLAPCSPAMESAMPDICRDGPGFDRTAFHSAFNADVVSFFKRYLVQAPKP